jgi:hypothetical protein
MLWTGIYIPDNVLLMDPENILQLRQQARLDKRLADAELRALHERAVDALLDDPRREEVRQKALLQVDRWERDQLCSPRYINAWRYILDLMPAELSQAILRDDAEGIALRQNSPFGFLVKPGDSGSLFDSRLRQE